MIAFSGVMTFQPAIHHGVVESARTLTSASLNEPGCRTDGFWAD
jgi:hypothetical protein